jgi:hypothetical protein
VLQEAITQEVQASITQDSAAMLTALSALNQLCAGIPELGAITAGVLPGLVTYLLSLPVRMPTSSTSYWGARDTEPPSITSKAFASLYTVLVTSRLDDQVRETFWLEAS